MQKLGRSIGMTAVYAWAMRSPRRTMSPCTVPGAYRWRDGSRRLPWMGTLSSYLPPTGRVSCGPGPVFPASSKRANSIKSENVDFVSWSVSSM